MEVLDEDISSAGSESLVKNGNLPAT